MKGVFLVILVFAFVHAHAEQKEAMTVKESITVQAVSQLVIHPQYRVSAQWRALDKASLAARVSAQVIKMHVATGQQVLQGETLIQLDCTKYIADMRQVESQLNAVKIKLGFDQREFNRSEKLKNNGSVGEAELDAKNMAVLRDQSELDGTNALLSNAKRSVSHCDVLAPFNGIVLEKMVSIGDWVNVGQPVISLLGNSSGELIAHLPLSMKSSFQEAESYLFHAEGAEIQAQLISIIPQVEEKTRSQKAVLSLGANSLAFGISGELLWTETHAYLPSSLLQFRDEKLGVFSVDNCNVYFNVIDSARLGVPFLSPFKDDVQLAWLGRQGLTDGMCIATEELP